MDCTSTVRLPLKGPMMTQHQRNLCFQGLRLLCQGLGLLPIASNPEEFYGYGRLQDEDELGPSIKGGRRKRDDVAPSRGAL